MAGGLLLRWVLVALGLGLLTTVTDVVDGTLYWDGVEGGRCFGMGVGGWMVFWDGVGGCLLVRTEAADDGCLH